MRLYDFLMEWVAQPHIIEEKTDGIWTYLKLSNGTAICWGTLKWTSTKMTAWGSCYTSEYSPSAKFPFAFVDKPRIFPVLGTTGIEGWVTNNRKETTTQTANYAIIRPITGGSMNLGINLLVVGKWK